MPCERFVQRPLSTHPSEPFPSAEDAWLWYARCQIARNEGVRFSADQGDTARPCDPDDIYRVAISLHRQRRLLAPHLAVLGRFGLRQSPPDPWGGDSIGDATLWAEALDTLETPLCRKGIIVKPMPSWQD